MYLFYWWKVWFSSACFWFSCPASWSRQIRRVNWPSREFLRTSGKAIISWEETHSPIELIPASNKLSSSFLSTRGWPQTTRNIRLPTTPTPPTPHLVRSNPLLKNTQEPRTTRRNSVLLPKLMLGIQNYSYRLPLPFRLSFRSSRTPLKPRREESPNPTPTARSTRSTCRCIRTMSPSPRISRKEWKMPSAIITGRSSSTTSAPTMPIRWFSEGGTCFSINTRRNRCPISRAWISMWELPPGFNSPTCSASTWARTWKGIRIRRMWPTPKSKTWRRWWLEASHLEVEVGSTGKGRSKTTWLPFPMNSQPSPCCSTSSPISMLPRP